MSDAQYHRDNHFVPRMYLRAWSCGSDRVWAYRLLVSHEWIAHWKHVSIRGVAYHEHLYTATTTLGETDAFERWLDEEFERPAQEAIAKATSDGRLTKTDWRSLVRFAASQDLRTPARLQEHVQQLEHTIPAQLQATLTTTLQRLERGDARVPPALPSPTVNADLLPLRVTIERNPDGDGGVLKAETVVGRAMWLFGMRHLLTNTVNRLDEHRWTILKPPPGLSWFTSDDPVVRLNYYKDHTYDFRGGWGNPGAEIFMPLGPKHLLYTHVGRRPPPRGSVMPHQQAVILRRMLAEHADRMIFAHEPDDAIQHIRPRTVNDSAFRDEAAQWRKWHSEQSAAERELRG